MRTLVLLALLVVVAPACSEQNAEPEPSVNVARDDRVPGEVRSELDAVTSRLFDSFEANDPSVLQGLWVEEVAGGMTQGAEADELFDALRQIVVETTLEPLGEFYEELPDPAPESVQLTSESAGGLVVSTDAAGEAIYVRLFRADEGFRERLLGLIYLRRDGAWRLKTLRSGSLRIDGKSAIDYFEEARGLYEQDLLLPAMTRLTVANDLLRPVSFLHYEREPEVRELQRKVQADLAAAYTFPIELPGGPQVYRIRPLFLQGQLSPAVQYVTRSKLERDVLQAEADQAARDLADLFPGLCHASDFVAFLAFNEPPLDPRAQYESVDLVAACPGSE